MSVSSGNILSHCSLNARVAGEICQVVAIPARNEEERLEKCLMALATQDKVPPQALAVVVLLNNTDDGSRGVVAKVASETGLPVELVDVELPAENANAGWARKLAMDHARHLVRDDGFLLTTDADTAADSDWISQNVQAMTAGADAVAGFVTADPIEMERIDAHVLAIGAKEWELQHLLAEIDARTDIVPHDPWPRHNQNCGASLAITASMYDRVGGLPALPVGEDRALMDKVRALDGRIRHSLAAHVVTSARLVGRAWGGMADALRTRGTADYHCDEILERADNASRRAAWRAQARKAFASGNIVQWCRTCDLGPVALERVAAAGTFGEAWSHIEGRHPGLGWHLLGVAELDCEIASARMIVDRLSRAH
jgi:glycosyltransferase involved in cell wall biosynthesis